MSDTRSLVTEAHFPGLTSVFQHPLKQEETSAYGQSRCHQTRHQNVIPHLHSAEKAFAETMAPFGGPGAIFSGGLEESWECQPVVLPLSHLGDPNRMGGRRGKKQTRPILLPSLTYLGVSVQLFTVGKSGCVESFRVLVRLLRFLPLFLGHHQREIGELLADQHRQDKPNPVSSSVFVGQHLQDGGKRERSNLLTMEIRKGSDVGCRVCLFWVKSLYF